MKQLKDLIDILDVHFACRIVNREGIEIAWLDNIRDLPYLLAEEKILRIVPGVKDINKEDSVAHGYFEITVAYNKKV